MEPSVASNASATKANAHRLLSQEQTQTVQGTKRKHQDLEEGRPSVSKSGRSSAKKTARHAQLLDDIFAKQRRTHAEITTTKTDGASAKIQTWGTPSGRGRGVRSILLQVHGDHEIYEKS